MKQQILIIHGGDVNDSYEEYLKELKSYRFDKDSLVSEHSGWKDTLGEKLGSDYEIFTPEMPNWMNAHYIEWKIWFEKMPPFLEGPVILIGHSLGAIFLAKYLAEERFIGKIKALFLLAPPFSQAGTKDPIGDFVIPKNLSRIEEQCDTIYIYHSKDDPLVTFDNALKYQATLPSAKLVVFENKGHFILDEFPEIVQQLKELTI